MNQAENTLTSFTKKYSMQYHPEYNLFFINSLLEDQKGSCYIILTFSYNIESHDGSEMPAM